jgi:hypothetical protein
MSDVADAVGVACSATADGELTEVRETLYSWINLHEW